MYKRYEKPKPVDVSQFDRSIDHASSLKDDFAFRKTFYTTTEWKELRDEILSKSKLFCSNCKRTNLMMNVDHILPIKFYWNKRLVRDNLQLLCGLCNAEKQNSMGTSWKQEALRKIQYIISNGLPHTTVEYDYPKPYVPKKFSNRLR